MCKLAGLNPLSFLPVKRNDATTTLADGTVAIPTISQPKPESKVAEAKKTTNNETTIFYLAKRESTKKALECLQFMINEKADGDQEPGTHTNKMFSDDLFEVKAFLFDEGEWQTEYLIRISIFHANHLINHSEKLQVFEYEVPRHGSDSIDEWQQRKRDDCAAH